MTKKQDVLYGIAFALIIFCAPAIVESKPLLAFGMIAVAGICVRLGERE